MLENEIRDLTFSAIGKKNRLAKIAPYNVVISAADIPVPSVSVPPPSPPKPDNITTRPINVPTIPHAGAIVPIDLNRPA